jgi:hypothetical protein
MKSDLDPRIVVGIIAAVVVIAAVGIYFGTRGQGDRSGPQVTARYQGGKGMGAGWHPGMTQAQVAHTAPGAPSSGAQQGDQANKSGN